MSWQTELQKLQRICRRAELWDDGGQPLVHLPDLKVEHAGSIVIVDGLLSPRLHSGYTTRLFFSRPFPNRGANWTAHNFMGGTWHTMSFNSVSADLSWDEILAIHLGTIR